MQNRRKRLLPVAAIGVLLGCGTIGGDLDRVIAIQLTGDLSQSIEEGGTLQLSATALDATGNPVDDAQIFWNILAVDSTQTLGITLDSVTGLVTGLSPSTARIQARIDNLRSGPLNVTVTGAADSIAHASDSVITFAVGQTQSPPLQVRVLDLTTNPGETLGLSGKTVRFILADGPSTTASITLSDTVVVGDGSSLEVASLSTGVAQALISLAEAPQSPDTILVDATVMTAANSPVAGSPVRFLVVIENSQ